MFLPYRTNAPVYHWPYATVGIIAVYLIAFVAASQGAIDPETLETLILQFGDGLHPLQWVTSSFIHGDILHLLGNMMFLWVFGLVVEGKVGWLRFLGIYFGLGVMESALEQTAFLWKEGGAFGASGILFGLMAISLVWAPENDVSVFYWFYRPGMTTVRIRSLCAIYLGLEVIFMGLDAASGDAVGSSFFHLTGAALGFPLGIALLKWGRVDCEGWDLLTLRKKRQRMWKTKAERGDAEDHATPPATGVDDKRADALDLIRDHLRAGDAEAARTVHQETQAETGPWPLDERDLLAMIQAHQKAKRTLEALPYLEEYLKRFPGKTPAVRLLLGKVLIEEARRPASGMEVLEGIPEGALKPEQEGVRRGLMGKARGMIEAGVLEMDV